MRRQTGLFTYVGVFSAALVETERKGEGGRKEVFRETGRRQAGRTCIPDFPVYLGAIASYDRYARVTYVSLLAFRDLELSGSWTERAISRRSGQGQVSTDMKQSRPRFYELFLGIVQYVVRSFATRGHMMPLNEVLEQNPSSLQICRLRRKRWWIAISRDLNFAGQLRFPLGRRLMLSSFSGQAHIRQAPRSQPKSRAYLFVSSCN